MKSISKSEIKKISTIAHFRKTALPLLLTALAFARSAPAQTNFVTSGNLDPDTLKKLLQRVDSQEAEIQALKSQLGHENAPATEPAPTMPPPPVYPNLQFHGFGDIDYAADNRKGAMLDGVTESGVKNSFFLGEYDLFVTSQLSEEFSVLSEVVLSADTDNNMGLDIERLLLQYHPNSYFNVDFGRFHTALGYYNNTYHHGTWFQNAVGHDPLYSMVWNSGANAGLHYGPSVGLRYDISTFVALKAQYDYLIDQGLNDASRLTLQAAFTF